MDDDDLQLYFGNDADCDGDGDGDNDGEGSGSAEESEALGDDAFAPPPAFIDESDSSSISTGVGDEFFLDDGDGKGGRDGGKAGRTWRHDRTREKTGQRLGSSSREDREREGRAMGKRRVRFDLSSSASSSSASSSSASSSSPPPSSRESSDGDAARSKESGRVKIAVAVHESALAYETFVINAYPARPVALFLKQIAAASGYEMEKFHNLKIQQNAVDLEWDLAETLEDAVFLNRLYKNEFRSSAQSNVHASVYVHWRAYKKDDLKRYAAQPPKKTRKESRKECTLS